MLYNYTFEQLVDLIGHPVASWPNKILQRYRKDSYKYDDRFALCVFNYMNGFDNKLFLEYALSKGALRDQQAVNHIKMVTQVLEGRTLKLESWYSFNLGLNRWMYLNGKTKFY